MKRSAKLGPRVDCLLGAGVAPPVSETPTWTLRGQGRGWKLPGADRARPVGILINLVLISSQRHGARLVSLHASQPSRSTRWGRHTSRRDGEVPTPSPGTLIIAGGSSGIGRCTANLFARHGWRVGLIARGEAGLAAAAAGLKEVGVPVAIAAADVTVSTALRNAAEAIVAELGPPDVWINCAGNGVYGRFTVTPEAQFDRVTAVTYGGTVNGCRIALALMAPRGQGTVVNVCSATAFHGLPLMTSYAGAKAAVRGFGQALQAELRMGRSRIRVSTVFPPAVNTPFFSHAVSHMGWPARPVAPVYQPEVVAAAIYLAAMRGRPEVVVSGTAAAFSIAARLSPRLIAFAMTRLGFDGQITCDPEVARLEKPTLFAPSAEASPVHGPFGRRARGRSVQVWLCRHGRTLLGIGLLAGAAAAWVTHGPALP